MKKTLRMLLAIGLIALPVVGVSAATKHGNKKPAVKVQADKPAPRSAAEIIAQSPNADWRSLDVENTVLMDLGDVPNSGPNSATHAGQVIIELAPRFAPRHVANIRALARDGFYDGLSIVRVQDNFVTQWGDPNSDDAALAKPLGRADAHLPAEFSIPLKGLPLTKLPDVDGWAPITGFVDGFPVAADAKTGQAWLAHCYGTVGAGRSNAKDSSTGAELYAVIGQGPRALDLNITVVGRVLKGMELLASLPRGGPNMGFYEKPEQRTAITRKRMMSDVPAAERPALQVLRTDSRTWAALLDARRNRTGWFVYSPRHIEVCSAAVPTRPIQ
jgi:peptidylprolyl isomerase